MGKKVQVSIVSYLNSKPFLHGLLNSDIIENIDLSLDIPSKVAAKLDFGLVDIGLVPVAALLENEKLEIITDKCIGSVGDVRTVVLASQVPLNEIDTILMDYQSRTSVLLAKVLAKFYWKKSFRWDNTFSGFENKLIEGNTAGVVIGDRVFDIEKKYKYIYDLSKEWFRFSGLPFVFAVWAANKPINSNFQESFSNALGLGLDNIREVSSQEQDRYPGIDIFTYLTGNIQFVLNDQMNKGLQLFLEMAKKLEPVELI